MNTANPQSGVHLSGVGGVGMSALAQILLDTGRRVSGSDRFFDQGEPLPVLDVLRRAGLQLKPQDGSAITPEVEALVVSTAIEADHPERLTAQRLGVPELHRAQMLARLVEGHALLAVAGTAGKTTTTAMLGWILEQIGVDPTVINGGALVNWDTEQHLGSVRCGRSQLWVVEADESDRSFLRFTPTWAIVTNISKDHFELDEVKRLFAEFAGRVRQGLVCGETAANTLRAMGVADVEIISRPLSVELLSEGYGFVFRDIRFTVPVLGRHNAENAWLAVQWCDRMGYDLRAVRDALKTFRGVRRRLEYVGLCNGARVYDDYAHNPAKISAAWEAVRPSTGRLTAVWRPHGFGPLAAMRDDLAAVFRAVARPGDRIFILPVFYAGGTARRALDSAAWVEHLREQGVPAEYVDNYNDLEQRICASLLPGDTVLVMGARDPHLPVFARILGRCG